jgi:hypothetical protein
MRYPREGRKEEEEKANEKGLENKTAWVRRRRKGNWRR